MSASGYDRLACPFCGYCVSTTKTFGKPANTQVACPKCKKTGQLSVFRGGEADQPVFIEEVKTTKWHDSALIAITLTIAVIGLIVSALAILLCFFDLVNREPLLRDARIDDIYKVVRNIGIYVQLLFFGKIFHWSITTVKKVTS